MTTSSSISPPKPIGVKTIPTNELQPNPHNPRLLFDKRPMDVLLNSIAKVGILVPLTVYEDSGTHKYIILDGQRRWMCAQALRIRNVPVNQVEEPDEIQNIVTMFQIHKFREDWELMPTALKLEILMKSLEERRENILAELTGLDAAVVSRCKKLLSFPKKYQEMMLLRNPADRVKADFFIELYALLSDVSFKKMKAFPRNKVTEKMLRKYEKGASGFKSVTDFRKIKQYFVNARKADKLTDLEILFKEFLEDDNLHYDHLEVFAADIAATARSISNTADNLSAQIGEIDAQQFLGEEDMWKSLERLLKEIRQKLTQADRRYE